MTIRRSQNSLFVTQVGDKAQIKAVGLVNDLKEAFCITTWYCDSQREGGAPRSLPLRSVWRKFLSHRNSGVVTCWRGRGSPSYTEGHKVPGASLNAQSRTDIREKRIQIPRVEIRAPGLSLFYSLIKTTNDIFLSNIQFIFTELG